MFPPAKNYFTAIFFESRFYVDDGEAIADGDDYLAYAVVGCDNVIKSFDAFGLWVVG